MRPIEWLAIIALAAGLAMRFAARPGAPFWMDEAATGAIVTQPDLASFLREVRWDVEAPLYYFVLRPWAAVFGASNAALRAPSVIFSLAAPLVIAFARVGRMERADRLTWAALVALWIPGAGFAQDARCYALVLFLASLQTLAFIRLLQATSNRSTLAWVATCVLTIAAHYDAAFLALAQGLIFVAVKRMEAVRRWWTLLLVAPLVGLLAWQWPDMVRALQPGVSWYAREDAHEMVRNGYYMLGGRVWLAAAPLLFILAITLRWRGSTRAATGIDLSLRLAATASAAGAAALIGVGALRPLLTARYLAPFVPGVLLLLLAALRFAAPQARPVVLGAALAVAVAIGVQWTASGGYHTDSVLEDINWETASAQVMKSGVRSVVFNWDGAEMRLRPPEQMAAFGGFFFHRAGAPIRVIPVRLWPGQDPNRTLLRAAAPDRSAIIWVFNASSPRSNARAFPPMIDRLDPRWRCQRSGGAYAILTCIPTTPPAPPPA